MLLRIIIFSESTNKNKKNKASNKLFHKKNKKKKETLQITTSLMIFFKLRIYAFLIQSTNQAPTSLVPYLAPPAT
jgi:hypothetical protein